MALRHPDPNIRRRATLLLAAWALGTLILLAASYAYHRWQTIDELEDRSTRTALRVDELIDRLERLLDRVDDVSLACHEDDLRRLRGLVFQNMEISEFGLFDRRGFLRCTSWGPVSDQQPHQPPPPRGVLRIAGVERTDLMGLPSLIVIRQRSDGSGANALVPVPVIQNVLGETDRDGWRSDLVSIDKLLPIVPGRRPLPVTRMDPPLSSGETRGISAEDGHLLVSMRRLASHPDFAILVSHPRALISERFQQTSVFILLAALLALLFAYYSVRATRDRRASSSFDLSEGLANNELLVYYQPVVDLRSGHCVGAEALVRWLHPYNGLMTPDLFLPVAERSGRISEVTQQVLSRVAMDMRPLLCAGDLENVAINLSAPDLVGSELLTLSRELFGGEPDLHDRLLYEITERMTVQTEDHEVQEAFRRLRNRGSRIALDDFGTGYSNFGYLSSLPIDVLKIDRLYVQWIGRDPERTRLVTALVELGRRLGLELIAEGVERAEQARFLREQGVTLAQGYFFARPMPIEEFRVFLEECREQGLPDWDQLIQSEEA